MIPVWLSLSAVSEASELRFVPSAGVTVGTNLSSNLNQAAEAADAISAVGASLATSGTAAIEAESWWAGATAQAAVSSWPAWPDLDAATFGFALPIGWSPVERLTFSLMPKLSARIVRDSDRTAFGPGISGSARLALIRRLSVRLGASYTWLPASEPVFEQEIARVSAGIEARVTRRTWIYGEYGLEGGQSILYVERPATETLARGTSKGKGTGKDGEGKRPEPLPDETFDTALVATRVPGIGHSLWLEIEQEINDWSFVRARGGWYRWITEPDGYDQWTAGVDFGLFTP